MTLKKHLVNARFRVASIFSGCGGFDLGFQQEGYELAAAFDNDFDATETYKANLQSPIELCDLTKTHPPDLLRGIDVLLAGPPCQGFSLAGKRWLDDPRNRLVILAAEIAACLQPKVFVLENVLGIAAGDHKTYWDKALAILGEAGYRTQALKVDATKTGVCQTRKRFLLIAAKGQNPLNLRLPIVPGGTLRQALSGIQGCVHHDPVLLCPGTHSAKIAARIKPGQKLSNVRNGPRSVHTWEIPEVFGATSDLEKRLLDIMLKLRRQRRVRTKGDADPLPANILSSQINRPVGSILDNLVNKNYVRRVGRLYDLAQSFNGKYRRLDWDKPSYTVDTRFGNPAYFLHPEENRGFTVREAARVQGFPDSYKFSGVASSQYRQIGNAVPPPLSRNIARLVREHLL